jgi:competence protein ComEC
MNILAAVVSGFSSGVFLRSFFYVGPFVFGYLLLLAIIVSIAYARTHRAGYALLLLFCVAFAFGVERMSVADSPRSSSRASQIHRRVSLDGVVVADQDVRETSQRVIIRTREGGGSSRILVVAKRAPVVHVGEVVNVRGTLDTPEPFATDGGRTFRYDKYLEKDNIRFVLNFATMRVTAAAPWYSMPAALAGIKHLFIDGLQSTLPHPQSALASGLVIGGKTALGKELQGAFVRSGLVQIVVLSGYNIMIVAEWVMALVSLVIISRRAQALAGAAALLLFVGVAGFSATALRATLMALIALYARATGRSYDAGRALFAAVFCMLIWNPLYLAFDPGFGLSVVATAGLIWLSPLIAQKLVRIPYASLRSAIATTLAAQFAVFPLLLYETGMLSLVALPANILAMPLVPIAMAFAAIAGCGGIIFSEIAPYIATVLATPAYATTTLLISLAKTATALPMSAVIIPAFPFVFVLLSYAVLAAIASSKRRSMTDQFTFAKKASI